MKNQEWVSMIYIYIQETWLSIFYSKAIVSADLFINIKVIVVITFYNLILFMFYFFWKISNWQLHYFLIFSLFTSIQSLLTVGIGKWKSAEHFSFLE